MGKKISRYRVEWMLYAFVSLCLGVLFGYMLLREHTQITAREQSRLVGAAQLSRTLIAHQLETIDVTLERIRMDLLPDWQTRGSAIQLLRNHLEILAGAMPSVHTLALLDATGEIVASNREGLIGQNFSHRDYFRTPQHNPAVETLYVSTPFEAITGDWLITLSKVIIEPSGEFGGVVMAALEPRAFSMILSAAREGQETWAGLVHGSGFLFIWEPVPKNFRGINLNVPGSMYERHVKSGRNASFFEGQVYINKEMSMLALHTIQPTDLHMNFSLVVGVGRSLEDIYAKWNRDVWYHGILYAALLFVGAVVLFMLQKERRIAEQNVARTSLELQELRTELENFFTIVPNLMSVMDLHGICRKLNPAWERDMGYRSADMEGLAFSDFIHPDDRATAVAMLQELQSGKTPRDYVARFRHKDGSYRFLEWSAAAHGNIIFTSAYDITEQKTLEMHLEDLAYHDPLTGLSNRALLLERLAMAVSTAKCSQSSGAVLFIDLDGFKKVNDEYGHDAGDTVLKVVAERLRSAVRNADTVARIGGDEFVVILQEIKTASAAGSVAQKILNAVRPEIAIAEGLVCRVGASIGVSVWPDDALDVDTLLLAADAAMYQSKRNGKNCFTYCSEVKTCSSEILPEHVVYLGIKEIDDQHIHIMNLINSFCGLLRDNEDKIKLDMLFAELQDYTSQHFSTEHKMMQNSCYPNMARHDSAHILLCKELEAIKAQMHKGGVQFMSGVLRTWLLEHITSEDAELGVFLKQVGMRGAES